MLSRSDSGSDLVNAPTSLSYGMTTSDPVSGWIRMAQGFLHILTALGIGALAAGGVLVALIWFSMRLPNG